MNLEERPPIIKKTPEYAKAENKETPPFPDLVIFNSTLYKDDKISKIRQELALNFFENARKLGIKCVVVDGGSNKEFLEKLKSFANVTLKIDPSLGMGESRREALRMAMEKFKNPYFLYADPEKYDLIKEKTISLMISQLRESKADIIVPKRTSMKSAPTKLQAWIEKRANNRARKIMNEGKEKKIEEELDLWFGPKMFNQDGAKYFQEYSGTLDKWDSIIVPVVNAYRDGKNIRSVNIDYQYDPSEKKGEEGSREMAEKRLKQYREILAEFDPYWEKNKKKYEGKKF
jgi:hypothetical protein